MEKTVNCLLRKYITKTITKEELDELKVIINLLDDEELSYFIYNLWDTYETKENISSTHINQIYKVIHTRTSQHSRKQFYNKISRIAAILIIPLLLASIWFLPLLLTSEKELAIQPMTVRTDKGQQSSVILFDGTIVQLNTASSLIFQQTYGEKDREVKLTGEAYFEVKSDSLKPFIVRTTQMDVEVLGTSFNMYVYEDETAEMALISGLVKVTTHTSPQQTFYIHPNEKIKVNLSENKWDIVNTDNRFETAWLRGELVFRSVPIKEVMQKLERRFDVQIHFDIPDIEYDRFTGHLNSEHIGDVMRSLQAHYKFTYTITGNQIYIHSPR